MNTKLNGKTHTVKAIAKNFYPDEQCSTTDIEAINSVANKILSQFSILADEIEQINKSIGRNIDNPHPLKLKFADIFQFTAIDGYPNISQEDFEQISDKDLSWFLNQLHKKVYITNQAGKGGIITIEDEELATLLWQEAPANGFKVISKIKRDKSVFGAGYYSPELLIQKPQLLNVYEYKLYINGTLMEMCSMRFEGYSENQLWYKFFPIGKNIDPLGTVHLLTTKEGSFPMHLKKLAPNVLYFERYDLNEKLTLLNHEHDESLIPKKFRIN